MSCFQCQRTGLRVCDNCCPLESEYPCRDCVMAINDAAGGYFTDQSNDEESCDE